MDIMARTKKIIVYLSDEEHKRVEDLAEGNSLPLSSFLRSRGLKGEKNEQ